MTGALDGLTVVVTRPAAQSARFIELARAAGARCIAYPTLLVEPIAPTPAALARLHERRWDWAIFTSTNAVAAAVASLALPFATHHAAVGRATARALEQAGLTVAARPDGATSEALLALPELAQLAGRGIVLVKGSGGRDLLAGQLRARGAEVLELELYRREAIAPEPLAAQALHAALLGCDRMVVTVTSAEILRSLLDHVAHDDAAHLRRQVLLVPGPRVALEASRQGWTGPVVTATTAEDESMMAALSRAAAAAGSSPPA